MNHSSGFLRESFHHDTLLSASVNSSESSTPSVSRSVLSRALYLLALSSLKDNAAKASPTSLLVLEHLSSELRGKALAEVCILPAGGARREAIEALMRIEALPLGEVTEIISSIDSEAVRFLLERVEENTPDDELRAFHLAVLEHSDMRIRATALRWIIHRQEGHAGAKDVLRQALYDREEAMRGAALYLLAEKKPSYGVDLLNEWFGGALFKKAGMDEKRRGALVLVHLAGESLLPQMRKQLRKFNVTGDQRVDEMRAAAVVVLGVLDDEESEKKIGKLSRSRLCGPALQEESKHVATAMKAKRAPYADPLKSMRKLALDLGYAERRPESEEPTSSDDFPIAVRRRRIHRAAQEAQATGEEGSIDGLDPASASKTKGFRNGASAPDDSID